MGYGYSNYNTAGVVMRNSFAEYVEKFNRTKPINSKSSGHAVPLGHRKHWKMASISMPDADTVCLNYYGSPLVVWKSDDSFEVFPPKYYSAYVVDNIQQFVPTNVGFGWNKGRLLVTQGDNAYMLHEGKSFKFRKAGNSYELVDVPVEYAVRKIRGSERKFIKLCEPFLEWADLVQSIVPQQTPDNETIDEIKASVDVLFKSVGLMTEGEYEAHMKTATWDSHPNRWDIHRSREHFPHGGDVNWRGNHHKGFNAEGCAKLYEWITSSLNDNWVHALNVLKHHQAERQHFRISDNKWGVNFKLNRTSAVKYISEIAMFLHFDECFRKVPLAVGEVPTKQNAEFLTDLGPVL